MYRQKLQEILVSITERKWRFLLAFIFVFFVTFFFFSSIGFVPENIDLDSSAPQVASESDTTTTSISGSAKVSYTSTDNTNNPVRIVIPSVNIDSFIENPSSNDIAVLDEALTRGVVHYPGSGLLNEEANIFLFGHSSFLPVVINKNYQAFNGLKLLKTGDEIFVQSSGQEYMYRVSSVILSDAEEVRVSLDRGVKKLTLSTCNSFGAKDERYVVEAEFVGSHSIES